MRKDPNLGRLPYRMIFPRTIFSAPIRNLILSWYYLMVQNISWILADKTFRRTNLFGGQNYRQQAKFSALLSVEILSDKVFFVLRIKRLRFESSNSYEKWCILRRYNFYFVILVPTTGLNYSRECITQLQRGHLAWIPSYVTISNQICDELLGHLSIISQWNLLYVHKQMNNRKFVSSWYCMFLRQGRKHKMVSVRFYRGFVMER